MDMKKFLYSSAPTYSYCNTTGIFSFSVYPKAVTEPFFGAQWLSKENLADGRNKN
jgi:hypothetical protein